MREGEILKIKPLDCQRAFTEALCRRRDISRQAITVITRSCAGARLNWGRSPDGWNLRFGVQILFTGRDGEQIELLQSQQQVSDSVLNSTTTIRSVVEEFAARLLQETIHKAAQHDTLVPKLCLYWAKDIEEMEDHWSNESGAFNPEIWSKAVLRNYEESMLLHRLTGNQTDPKQVVGDMYGIDVTASDRQAIQIIAKNRPPENR